MALSRPIKAAVPISYTVTLGLGAADRNFYFKTTAPLKFESLQYGADFVDSTHKFLVVFSVTDPAGTNRVYVTGTLVTTADAITEFTTLDGTALPGGFIPTGSTIKLLIDFDAGATPANVLGISVRLDCVMAH